MEGTHEKDTVLQSFADDDNADYCCCWDDVDVLMKGMMTYNDDDDNDNDDDSVGMLYSNYHNVPVVVLMTLLFLTVFSRCI